MAGKVQAAFLEYIGRKPKATDEEIAKFIRKTIPTARTTPASVACMKSRMRTAIARGEPLTSGAPASMTYEALPEKNPNESLKKATERIALRYGAMERLAQKAVQGEIPSLIISGPPGLGKSYTVDKCLKDSHRNRFQLRHMKPEPDPDDLGPDDMEDESWSDASSLYDKISGSISEVGLYIALWNMRHGGVVYIDDCDEVFRDETCLNMLKVATDSTKERLISWRKESNWLREYGIEPTFQFNGHVVFLTNIDFEMLIQKGHKDTNHFQALIDRAHYLCLTLRTRRDFMIRIRTVAGGKEGMLASVYGFSPKQIKQVLDYVEKNQTKFYNLSLRLVGQIAQCMKADPDNWQKDIEATKMRTY